MDQLPLDARIGKAAIELAGIRRYQGTIDLEAFLQEHFSSEEIPLARKTLEGGDLLGRIFEQPSQ